MHTVPLTGFNLREGFTGGVILANRVSWTEPAEQEPWLAITTFTVSPPEREDVVNVLEDPCCGAEFTYHV